MSAAAARYSVLSDNIELLSEAVRLNHVLVNEPFADADLVIETTSNLLEFHQAVRNGEDMPLRHTPTQSACRTGAGRSPNGFQPWCREIVWWGNKKGAYLYGHSRHPSVDWRVRYFIISEWSAALRDGGVDHDAVHRKLGRTDITVSEIGFGAWGIGCRTAGQTLRRHQRREFT